MTLHVAKPRTDILTLDDEFYDLVEPADFPQTILRFRNVRAATEIGLEGLIDSDWVAHFGRFHPLPGSLPKPLALRYHGHQFRQYNPELGDGRGFLFAQLEDAGGRLMDLGTKGSGQTPWSRAGDGRLTLKGAVREILATEMLEALGVTTSRTLSVIETGEKLMRGDEPSPTRSAVLVRLSHSHVRYGTFQRLAALDKPAEIERLTHYVLERLAKQPAGDDPYSALMHYAVAGAARLAAEWHVAGFVHGVLNTDNMNITGESFDYGPWRFLPQWDMGFTAAYFDQFGLYAFGRQAEALQWNLFQLAQALRRVAPAESLIPALKSWPDRLAEHARHKALWRLGLQSVDATTDEALIRAFETGLAESQIQPDTAWHAARTGRPLPTAFAPYTERATAHASTANTHTYWSDEAPCTMLIEEVESLWQSIADQDDWAPLATKLTAIRRMGAAHRPSGPASGQS